VSKHASHLLAVASEFAGTSPIHRRLYARLVLLLSVVVLVDLGAALLVRFALPHGGEGGVHTTTDAFPWSTQHLLSGGSSFGTVSPEMRWVEVVLQVVGITAVASLGGALGAFFHRRDLDEHPLAVSTQQQQARQPGGP
jgi:hypothetical protein